MGSCVQAVVAKKLEPEPTAAAILACVEAAVSRDVAEQAALAAAETADASGGEDAAHQQ